MYVKLQPYIKLKSYLLEFYVSVSFFKPNRGLKYSFVQTLSPLATTVQNFIGQPG